MQRFAIFAVLALVAASCSPAATTGGGAGGAINVALDEYSIKAVGDPEAGKPFTLTVKNAGHTIHTLAIEAAGETITTAVLQSGASEKLSVPPLPAGAYRLWCTVAGHRESGMESALSVGGASTASLQSGGLSPEEIDRMHAEGLKAFPAKTKGLGGVPLEPVIQNGVKVFTLTADAIRWEVSPGEIVDAFAFNGVVPGPEIHVKRGDRMRVVLTNNLPESTSIHFHGMRIPNAMDGVPFLTQDPVRKGETFTYEFPVVDVPGTHMYHSHHNALKQVGMGLFGTVVVEPGVPQTDVAYTMVLGDGELGYTINGKGFPATQPIVAKLGQTVLVRFLNAGQALHPMHLHGFHFRVVARDGVPTTPYTLNTLTVAPGEVYDGIFTADNPGAWAFHCHVLSHAESEHGMHGMVTAVIVQ
ncbi:MAG TPA: multicopper oxidase domain-containing protein [Actinomycetota bacterium]